MLVSIEDILGNYQGVYTPDECEDVTLELELKKGANKDKISYSFFFAHYHNHGYEYCKFEGSNYKLKKDALILLPHSSHFKKWEDYFNQTIENHYKNHECNLELSPGADSIDLIFDTNYRLFIEEDDWDDADV